MRYPRPCDQCRAPSKVVLVAHWGDTELYVPVCLESRSDLTRRLNQQRWAGFSVDYVSEHYVQDLLGQD